MITKVNNCDFNDTSMLSMSVFYQSSIIFRVCFLFIDCKELFKNRVWQVAFLELHYSKRCTKLAREIKEDNRLINKISLFFYKLHFMNCSQWACKAYPLGINSQNDASFEMIIHIIHKLCDKIEHWHSSYFRDSIRKAVFYSQVVKWLKYDATASEHAAIPCH